MLEEFLSASRRVDADLQRAAAERRWVDAERAAHTLKSMARMVGAVELAEACALVEGGAAGALPPDAVEAVARRVVQAQGAVKACLL